MLHLSGISNEGVGIWGAQDAFDLKTRDLTSN
jgi:hypothetical protein